MQPLKAILIDDEIDARENLRFFAEQADFIEIIGEAGSVKESLPKIQKLKPDLLFLDIEMPDGTGFDLLEKFPNPDFQIVFTTAHDEFAIKAFQFNALDYLLKPIDGEEFERVIKKLENALPPDWLTQVSGLLSSVREKQFEKLLLPTSEGLNVVEINEIISIHADGSYCEIYLIGNERLIVSKNLKELEDLLEVSRFARVHQSFLINLAFVKKVLREDGGMILMKNGTKVPLARRRKDDFLEKLTAIGRDSL